MSVKHRQYAVTPGERSVCLITRDCHTMQPLVFTPYLRPMVWGGRALAERLGKTLPTAEAYGESWELSTHPLHISRVAEGPHHGQSLADLCRELPRDLLGKHASRGDFPLLIKFLDCRQLLSIQVHPPDALASRLANERHGKTEAWVVLHAEPESRIYAGFRAGVQRAEVERHLADGQLAKLLHDFVPHPGDVVFLPAGTVHAVGGGVLLAEVQQASDATFRLFDWNRVGSDGKPRQLHIEAGLASINWSAGPVFPLRLSPAPGRVSLVESPYFRLERWQLSQPTTITAAGRPVVWLVLAGAAALTGPDHYQRTCASGTTILIPAACPEVCWQPRTPELTLLAVHLHE